MPAHGKIRILPLRFEEALSHLRESKCYDVLIAAPWIILSIYVVCTHLTSLGIAVRDATPAIWLSPHTMLAILSRVILALFFALQFSLICFRTMPAKKTETILPKAAALIGATFGLSFSLLTRSEPSPAVEFASALITLLGAAGALYSIFWLGRSFSIMPEARGLVMDGAYRVLRHPLYACELMMIFGISIQLQQPASTILLVGITGFLAIRIGYEEKILTECFPAYASYALQTKRLVPFVY
jgi:protein-S-isoprenylcysteine O-methyltransferase Ste14